MKREIYSTFLYNVEYNKVLFAFSCLLQKRSHVLVVLGKVFDGHWSEGTHVSAAGGGGPGASLLEEVERKKIERFRTFRSPGRSDLADRDRAL